MFFFVLQLLSFTVRQMLHRQEFQLWGFGTCSCLNETLGLLAAFNEKWKHFSALPDLSVTELFIWCFSFSFFFITCNVIKVYIYTANNYICQLTLLHKRCKILLKLDQNIAFFPRQFYFHLPLWVTTFIL